MNLKLSLVVGSLLCLVSHPVFGGEIDDSAAAFSKLANGIIAQAVAGSVDAAGVQKDVVKMEALAADFALKYKAKYPAGAKLMDFMIAQKDGLTKMSLADIDAGFESEAINKAHGAELGLDLTVEANEHFGNAVDLFVHPATADICARLWQKDHKDEQLQRIKSELQEVIEHCHKVVDALKK
jgi:hypothetical protein